MDEPTAWEDINPTTALAPQAERHSPSLAPATSEQFRNELTACLALVVPVGMTEEARREWLLVAWETLKHLPPDILHYGCEEARKTSDHPSKIVPAITAATDDWMKLRQTSAATSEHLYLPAPTEPRRWRGNQLMDNRGKPMSDEETDELNGILESLGASARYRPDGTRYLIEKAA
jgi:hypothetical protein